MPADVKLKDTKDQKLIGTPVHTKLIPDIVTGRVKYGIDTQVPGMLYALIARCPVYKGKLKRFDATRARKIKGVHRIFATTPIAGPQHPPWMPHDIRDGVAVVADSFWTAQQGARAARDRMGRGPERADSSTADFEIIAQERALHRTDPTGFVGDENAVADLSKVRKTLRASYVYPHQLHSCMEPLNCTAFVKADECEIWCGSQVPNLIVERGRRTCSKLPAEKVQVHLMPSGGGFGRRAYPDMAVEAAFISREAGNVPVKMLWTREDDQTCNLVHLFQHMEYQAALDGAGQAPRVVREGTEDLQLEPAHTSIRRLSAMAYDIPNIRYDLEDIIDARAGALVGLARRGRARQGAERVLHRRDRARAQAGSAGVSTVDAEARPRRLRRSQPDALQRPHAPRAHAGGRRRPAGTGSWSRDAREVSA